MAPSQASQVIMLSHPKSCSVELSDVELVEGLSVEWLIGEIVEYLVIKCPSVGA